MAQQPIFSEKSSTQLIANPFEAIERIESTLRRIEHDTLPSLLKRILGQGASHDGQIEKLISKRDAARLLGCSVSTIDNLRRSGKLELVKVGKSARFRLSDLQSIIGRESK